MLERFTFISFMANFKSNFDRLKNNGGKEKKKNTSLGEKQSQSISESTADESIIKNSWHDPR